MTKNIVLLVLMTSLFTGCLWHDNDWGHRHNRPSSHHDSDHRPDSNHHDHADNQHDDHNRPPPPR